MKHEIVKPELSHIVDLAENMSTEASNEVWAATRMTPYEALSNSVWVSRDAYAWLVNGRCMAMFGVAGATALSSTGQPWMLGAKDLPKYAKTFMKGCPIILQDWLRQYPVLRNVVDARYTVAIRWLQKLGFTILPPIPVGPDQMMFHPFEIKRA
jgi:hypothetical protein